MSIGSGFNFTCETADKKTSKQFEQLLFGVYSVNEIKRPA